MSGWGGWHRRHCRHQLLLSVACKCCGSCTSLIAFACATSGWLRAHRLSAMCPAAPRFRGSRLAVGRGRPRALVLVQLARDQERNLLSSCLAGPPPTRTSSFLAEFVGWGARTLKLQVGAKVCTDKGASGSDALTAGRLLHAPRLHCLAKASVVQRLAKALGKGWYCMYCIVTYDVNTSFMLFLCPEIVLSLPCG